MKKIVLNFCKFLIKLSINLVYSSSIKHVITPDGVLERRLKQCLNCEKLIYSFGRPRCSECGCFVMKKTKFIFEVCPLNKWE